MKRTNVQDKYRKFFYETTRQKVLEYLFRYPDLEFSLSDLAKEISVSKGNLGDILREFHKDELILLTPLSKIWRVKANQQNWFFRKSKIVFNLNAVYQSGLVEFLNDFYQNPRAMILFGSFRWGADISSSDIDIAIEIDQEVKDEARVVLLRQLVADNKKNHDLVVEIEEYLSRNIQVLVFNKKSRENVDLHVFNNIANGIVLGGFLEVKL